MGDGGGSGYSGSPSAGGGMSMGSMSGFGGMTGTSNSSYGGAGSSGYGESMDGMISTSDVADSVYGPGFSDGAPASMNYSPDFSYADMQGFGAMTGEGNNSYAGESEGAFAAPDENMFTRVMKNPWAKMTLAVLAKSNPAVATAMKAYSMYNAVSNPSNALGMAAGTLGGMAGANMAGPVGAVAGSYMGNKAGGYAAANSAPGGPTGPSAGMSQGGGNTSEMLAGLGSLYAGRQADRSAKTQINQLQGLYAPQGQYAQHMRQALERKDAAGGRRSQYGPREAQLMAQLSEQAARSAPQLQSLYNQRDVNRAQMLRSGLASYDRMGGMQGIGRGLGDIYQGAQDTYNSVAGMFE